MRKLSAVLATLVLASSFPISAMADEKQFDLILQPVGILAQSGLTGCCDALTPGVTAGYHIDAQSVVSIEFQQFIFNTNYQDSGKKQMSGYSIGASY